MIDNIRNAIHATTSSNEKIAMFHFQVLKNAKELEGLDPKNFCKEIGVPATYGTEFIRMIALARLMKEQGVRLA